MHSSGPGRDEGALARELDELVFECLERIEVEGERALDELCRAHPDFAGVLRARIHALRDCGWLDGKSND